MTASPLPMPSLLYFGVCGMGRAFPAWFGVHTKWRRGTKFGGAGTYPSCWGPSHSVPRTELRRRRPSTRNTPGVVCRSLTPPPRSWSASPVGPGLLLCRAPRLPGSGPLPGGVRRYSWDDPAPSPGRWATRGGRWALWTLSRWSGRSPGGRRCPSPLESRSRPGLGSEAPARVSSSRPSASVLPIRTL